MNKTALDDSYLRAAFCFLTSPSEKYEAVLVGNQAMNLLQYQHYNIWYLPILYKHRTK
jgi:hypothetical protein